MARYNNMELMIAVAARTLEDGAVVLVGTGAPVATAMLAQMTHAPNLVILFEAGGVAPLLPTMPISVGDSRTTYKALKATSMAEIMEFCQAGMVDYCFLGGAQIDQYGNLNSTLIGDSHQKPQTRFPGSGGANDLASLCWRTMVVTPQNSKRFAKKLDFLTTPGYLNGGDSRAKAGLPKDTGPYRVITDIGVYGYHEQTKAMMLISLHPGKTAQDVSANSSFDIFVPETYEWTAEPTDAELAILRGKVDPGRVIIGRSA